jgi:hypothetical protein
VVKDREGEELRDRVRRVIQRKGNGKRGREGRKEGKEDDLAP